MPPLLSDAGAADRAVRRRRHVHADDADDATAGFERSGHFSYTSRCVGNLVGFIRLVGWIDATHRTSGVSGRNVCRRRMAHRAGRMGRCYQRLRRRELVLRIHHASVSRWLEPMLGGRHGFGQRLRRHDTVDEHRIHRSVPWWSTAGRDDRAEARIAAASVVRRLVAHVVHAAGILSAAAHRHPHCHIPHTAAAGRPYPKEHMNGCGMAAVRELQNW